MIEAKCLKCGETFIETEASAEEYGLTHLEHEDGTECGGDGEVVGEWR